MTDELAEPNYHIYKWIPDVEDIERYEKGGYHPVVIDEEIHGRYRVVHKLGYGSYSTVWLARDQLQNRYAALKIVTADRSSIEGAAESRILNQLQGKGSSWSSSIPKPMHQDDDSGSTFSPKILDEFEIQGPNGNHRCIITEPLGPSLYSVLDELDGHQFPLDIGRKIVTQIAKGLSYLHTRGVVHGDLHLGNILFRIPGLDLWSDEQVYEHFGKPQKVKLKRLDGQALDLTPLAPTPEYVVRPPSPQGFLSLCLTDACAIQIVDFGEAFVSTGQSVPGKILDTPVWYSAPEVLFEDPVGPSSDIWALACVLYRILSGNSLFRSLNGDQDEILVEMVCTLGKLPDHWWHRWEKRPDYFTEDGTFQPISGLKGAMKKTIGLKVRLSNLVSRSGKDLLGPEDMAAFEKMLQGMLRFEPGERISADKVVQLLPSACGYNDLV